MESVRIFIGNLNITVENQHLQEEFSNYGSVLNIDIKSKSDFDGNLISKFAYVTIESRADLIAKCVSTLNGSTWNGTVLKVDVARESFLQRLKKEREQNLNDKYIPQQVTPVVPAPYNFATEKESTFGSTHQWKSNNDQPNLDNYNDRFSSSSSIQAAGIKRYDPTVADREYLCSRKNNTAEVKPPPKYLGEKFVKVSDDLEFKGDSEGFSLLATFSNLGKKEANEEKFNGPLLLQESLLPKVKNCLLPKIQDSVRPNNFLPAKSISKSSDFFISPNDPRLSAGVEWLLTPLTPENLQEFRGVRKELIDLYKLRNIRAVQNASKNKKRKFRPPLRNNRKNYIK